MNCAHNSFMWEIGYPRNYEQISYEKSKISIEAELCIWIIKVESKRSGTPGYFFKGRRLSQRICSQV